VRRRRWRRTIQRTHPRHRSLCGRWGRRRGRSYVAKYLTNQLGQQVYIDNRGGAGGTIGTDIAARAHADGYTLVEHTISSAVLNKFLYTRVKLDVNTRFAPISQIGPRVQLLAINAKVPAQNLQEFIALLKANPGRYRYGSSGLGAIMHLSGELFVFMSKPMWFMCLIEAKGRRRWTLLAAAFISWCQRSRAAAACPLRRTARFVRERRSSPGVAADVPTAAEAGLPGYQTYNWHACSRRSARRSRSSKRLNEALAKGLATPS